MIFHVLPGDAQVEEFKKTGLEGEVIVCREALVSGPMDADNLDEFWDQRARFILAEYAEDEIEYHEKVAAPLNKLSEVADGDEVNLWFEYELFCSANLWFCLSILKEASAGIYRIEPLGLDEADRWNGFAGFTAEDMLAAHSLRTKFTDAEVELGAGLWRAYSRGDSAELTSLADRDAPCFPYLKEVVAAAAEQDIRPLEVVREITAAGETDFAKIFVEFRKRAGVYGYGDLQVQRLIDQLSSKSSSG